MDISHETGDRIRYYRKKKQMTIDQLAAAICKSKSCVSKYENGQIAVDLPTLYDIAAALEVRVTQLLYLPPDRTAGTPSGTVPAFLPGWTVFTATITTGGATASCAACATSWSKPSPAPSMCTCT